MWDITGQLGQLGQRELAIQEGPHTEKYIGMYTYDNRIMYPVYEVIATSGESYKYIVLSNRQIHVIG